MSMYFHRAEGHIDLRHGENPEQMRMKKMKRNRNTRGRNRGSAIIEYTVVFPLVLLIIFALFYAGFMLYQRSVLDGAVNRGTIYAARILSDPQYATVVSSAGADGDGLDCETDTYDFDADFEIEPYRYILNFNGEDAQQAVENGKYLIDFVEYPDYDSGLGKLEKVDSEKRIYLGVANFYPGTTDSDWEEGTAEKIKTVTDIPTMCEPAISRLFDEVMINQVDMAIYDIAAL